MPNYARGIDPSREKPILISEAALYAGVTPATVYNWIMAGKLRASKIRGRYRTSREAVDELNAPEPIELPEPVPRTPVQTRRATAKAIEFLRANGVDC